jgi:hypothetical protein
MGSFDGFVNYREPFRREAYRQPNFTSQWKKIPGWKGPYKPYDFDFSPYQYAHETLCDGRYLSCDVQGNRYENLKANRLFCLTLIVLALICLVSLFLLEGEFVAPFSGHKMAAASNTFVLSIAVLTALTLYYHIEAKKYNGRYQKYVVFDREEQLVYFPARQERLYWFIKVDYPATVIPFKDVEFYSAENTMTYGGSYFIAYIGSHRMYHDNPESLTEKQLRGMMRLEPLMCSFVDNHPQAQRFWNMVCHFMDKSKPYPDSLTGIIQDFHDNGVDVFFEPMPEEERRIKEPIYDFDSGLVIKPTTEVWKKIAEYGDIDKVDDHAIWPLVYRLEHLFAQQQKEQQEQEEKRLGIKVGPVRKLLRFLKLSN